MTREQARAEAHRRWGTPGVAPGDRYGVVLLRTKTSPARFEVGFIVRPGRTADGGVVHFEAHTCGRGTTWEDAFEDADRGE